VAKDRVLSRTLGEIQRGPQGRLELGDWGVYDIEESDAFRREEKGEEKKPDGKDKGAQLSKGKLGAAKKKSKVREDSRTY